MPDKKDESTWYGDAWESIKSAPQKMWDIATTPSPRVSVNAQGKVFTPPKPNAKGQITQRYPKVNVSAGAMWHNFHPIDFGVSLLKAIPQLPQAPDALASLQRGMRLVDNQQKYGAYKAAHPRVPDTSNPYYMSPEKYRKLRGLESLAEESPFHTHSRYTNPQLEMQKDMYIARAFGASYSYTDNKGVSHTDWNHVKDIINRHPEDIITTLIPFIGQATKLAQTGKLFSALSKLEQGTGAAAAAAKVTRLAAQTVKGGANIAMKATDPINQIVLPKVIGAAVKGGTRLLGSNGINIFNPEFAKAWESYLTEHESQNPDGFVRDPELQNHIFQQFQKDTGGQYGAVFNPETIAAMQKAGVDPSRLSSPSQWTEFQKKISRTGQVISPAGVRDAVAKMGGAETVTTGTALQKPGSYLFTRFGHEQAARDAATAQVDANLQSKFGSAVTDKQIARHAVDSVLSGNNAGPITFRSRGLGSEYTYDPVKDVFTYDRGSNYTPPPGKTRYVTIDSSNPQYQVLKNEVSGISTNYGITAAGKSPNPIFKQIATNYNNGFVDPADLAKSVEHLVSGHILSDSGGLAKGGGNSVAGELNYKTLGEGLSPQGKADLDAYLKQQMASSAEPNSALEAADVLQQRNPDLFRVNERPALDTGLSGKNIVTEPVPKGGGKASLLEGIKNRLVPDTSRAALLGYFLSQSPEHAAIAAGANLAWKAGEELMSPIGLSDRFGAPITLDPSKFYSGKSPTNLGPALGAEATRQNQNILGYGGQFDENQKPKPLAAPAPPPPPQPREFMTNVAPPPTSSTGAPQKSDWDAIMSQPSPSQSGSAPVKSDWDAIMQLSESAMPQRNGGRIAYKKGGAVNSGIEHLVQGLMSRYKAVKRSQDNGTKTLLRQPDQAIVKALDVAQKAI